MNSKITHTSNVISFTDIGFKSKEIQTTIKSYVERTMKTIHADSLTDWQIIFNIVYSSDQRSLIRLYKQYPSYKKTKQKELFIHIPIPIKSVVDWGVEESQLVNLPVQMNENKYCSYIDIDFKVFHNRNDYIIAAAHKAIRLCFEQGFTVNGVSVIIKSA
ncbi:hypothetical protein KLP40_01535 [Hymenobacter sp. NST-14]|uniref:Imm9 family immunity protein n=1 Tax=Hymenobacter piscis TaxID=2839984 RepID=UPI001C0182E6|nr:Imm9 family immunity protein [Hymenobacter piscis]MBT9391830.1 hypothetical protein [Hymenobacter piscis]